MMVEPVAEILSPVRLALANQFLKLFVFVLAGINDDRQEADARSTSRKHSGAIETD